MSDGPIIPSPGRVRSRNDMGRYIAGTCSRCTGYDKIIRAVLDAAAELRAAPLRCLRKQPRQRSQSVGVFEGLGCSKCSLERRADDHLADGRTPLS
jgi:xanthine dehydrogenase iron-sulfur cluster and FAD-binding subunit A